MYQEILATDPHNFDVLHLLGLAAYQDRQLAAAEAFLVQAIAIKSDFWQIYASYGRTLHDLARLEDASTSYDMAVILNPEDADIYCEDLGSGSRDIQQVRDRGPGRAIPFGVPAASVYDFAALPGPAALLQRPIRSSSFRCNDEYA